MGPSVYEVHTGAQELRFAALHEGVLAYTQTEYSLEIIDIVLRL